jgi:ribosome maturation factor RimP
MTARPTARTGPDTAARRERVRALLAPVVAETGVDLEDVELRTVGRRLVLKVLVDTSTGISLDEVAAASQAVSDALDASDVLGDEPYTLEVSSPGVDRPLTEPRHWRRNLGRLVAVTRTDGSTATARVVDVSDDGATVELEESVKGRTSRSTLALSDVARAVVEVEFSRAAAADLDDESAAADDDSDDEADEADDDEADDDSADAAGPTDERG